VVWVEWAAWVEWVCNSVKWIKPLHADHIKRGKARQGYLPGLSMFK